MCSFPNIYAPPGIRNIIEIPHGLWRFSALPDSSTLIFLVGLSQFSSSDISISSSRRMPMSCSLWAFRSSWKLRVHERQSLSQWSFSVLWLTHEHLEPAAFPFQTLPPPDLGKPPEGYRRGGCEKTESGIRFGIIPAHQWLGKGSSANYSIPQVLIPTFVEKEVITST